MLDELRIGMPILKAELNLASEAARQSHSVAWQRPIQSTIQMIQGWHKCPSTYDSSSRFETIHNVIFHTYPSISQNIYIIYLWIFQIFLNIYNQYISSLTAYDQPTDNPIDIDVCPSELFHHWIGSVQAIFFWPETKVFTIKFDGFSCKISFKPIQWIHPQLVCGCLFPKIW